MTFRATPAALLTDLYQLTMAQSYLEHGMTGDATFSLYIRNFPPNRGYLVAAGVEDVLDYLEEFGFSSDDLGYLRSTRIFTDHFLEYLRTMRFTGSVRAMPEGRLFFVNEPLLEVTAPIIEGQIVETYLINLVNFAVLLATKAARCVHAAQGKPIVDFSLRRVHGTDTGLRAARFAYLAGVAATSNVLAGKLFEIPVAGTMAHSFISAHESEVEAFRHLVETFPDRSILLIDTYDTMTGARNAAQVGIEMRARGQQLRGVRIDSGDLGGQSRRVREILDQAGLHDTAIFASGGLDEFRIEELVDDGAPIDSYAVGTKMGSSADAPWSDMAYKLVSYAGRPTIKLSEGKTTLPNAKQVYRFHDANRILDHDMVALATEDVPTGEPLLITVMEGGARTGSDSLDAARQRFQRDFSVLPVRFKTLTGPAPFDVRISSGLADLIDGLRQ